MSSSSRAVFRWGSTTSSNPFLRAWGRTSSLTRLPFAPAGPRSSAVAKTSGCSACRGIPSPPWSPFSCSLFPRLTFLAAHRRARFRCSKPPWSKLSRKRPASPTFSRHASNGATFPLLSVPFAGKVPATLPPLAGPTASSWFPLTAWTSPREREFPFCPAWTYSSGVVATRIVWSETSLLEPHAQALPLFETWQDLHGRCFGQGGHNTHGHRPGFCSNVSQRPAHCSALEQSQRRPARNRPHRRYRCCQAHRGMDTSLSSAPNHAH